MNLPMSGGCLFEILQHYTNTIRFKIHCGIYKTKSTRKREPIRDALNVAFTANAASKHSEKRSKRNNSQQGLAFADRFDYACARFELYMPYNITVAIIMTCTIISPSRVDNGNS